jgi:hypothetical protein
MEHDPLVANADAANLIRMIDAKIDANQIERRAAELLQEAIDEGYF